MAHNPIRHLDCDYPLTASHNLAPGYREKQLRKYLAQGQHVDGGARTHDFWIMSQVPYPLDHMLQGLTRKMAYNTLYCRSNFASKSVTIPLIDKVNPERLIACGTA